MKTKLLISLFVTSGLFLISSPCRAVTASGTVVDQDGSPVAGAAVHAAASGLVETADGRQEGLNLTAVTDERGAFEVTAAEGNLRITAVKKGEN